MGPRPAQIIEIVAIVADNATGIVNACEEGSGMLSGGHGRKIKDAEGVAVRQEAMPGLGSIVEIGSHHLA